MQLELGSTATTYEPYIGQEQLLSLGSIELAKIGDYTDRIFKQDGKWWLEKNIGKVTVNGSENWTSFSIETTGLGRASYDIGNCIKGNSNVIYTMCNKVIGVKYSGSWNVTYDCVSSSGGGVLYMYLQNVTSLQEFTSALSSGFLLYYVLATPTTTEITDTTLIRQLENVLKMTTYKNITNIFDVVVSPNKIPYLQVTYKQDLDTLLDNLDARISLLE